MSPELEDMKIRLDQMDKRINKVVDEINQLKTDLPPALEVIERRFKELFASVRELSG